MMRYEVEKFGDVTVIIINGDVMVQAVGVSDELDHLIVTCGKQAVKNVQFTYYSEEETKHV